MNKYIFIFEYYDDDEDIQPMVHLIYVDDCINKAIATFKATLTDMMYYELADNITNDDIKVINLNEFKGYIHEVSNPI